MSKPFLEQLQEWVETKNFSELDKCEWKVSQMLRQWGSLAEEMKDKASWLHNEPLALACVKELKLLKKLVKQIDAAYKDKTHVAAFPEK